MMHEKQLFAFDWDDVIFDAPTFKQAIAAVLTQAGALPEAIWAPRRKIITEVPYSFSSHVDELMSEFPDLGRQMREQLMNLWGSAGSLVYPDALSFLHGLAGQSPTALITAGDPDFQQRKLAATGLKDSFHHSIFVPVTGARVPKAKAAALGQLLELYPSIIYFDDRADIIEEIHRQHGRHGRITPIRVARDLKTTIPYPHIIRHFGEFTSGRAAYAH